MTDGTKLTLPHVAILLGIGVDVIRKEIRRRPGLRDLGEQFGPVRVYGPAAVERIRAALAERRGLAVAS
jgi:hypothetical protein